MFPADADTTTYAGPAGPEPFTVRREILAIKGAPAETLDYIKGKVGQGWTWESFPAKYRPLPGRTNIVVSRRQATASQMREAGAVVVPGFQEALEAAHEADGLDLIWVIGGATLFEQALDVATLAEITLIDTDADGDTFAPELDARWTRTAVDPHAGTHRSRTGLSIE